MVTAKIQDGLIKFMRVKGNMNHNLYRRGDVYWVRFRKSGKPALQESLGTEALGDARLRRDERIAKYLGVRAKHQGRQLLGERFVEWFELNETNWAPATCNSVMNSWGVHLVHHYRDLLISEAATESEWLRYVQNSRTSRPKRKFFNDRKYLSMFFHWCHREGFLEKLPRLPDVDPEIKAGKVYTQSEIDALLFHANIDLSLQITMAITMGMRLGEILSLEWSQVNFETGVVHLPAAKTKIRKERSFVASPEVLGLLESRQARSNSAWVFPSPSDPKKCVGKGGNKSSWTLCRAKAKVKGRFHDLRHTFLTRAFKTAVNPALICHYAGVSLEEAERTYLHFSVDDTRAVAGLVRSV